MATVTDTADRVIVARPVWQRILLWVGIAIAALALLVVLLVMGLNTGPGRRFLVDQIGGYKLASGLNVKIGRIDGSIYGAMTVRDLRVADDKGVFLTSPQVDVDWRPFAFAQNHIDIRSLSAGEIALARIPELKTTDPDAPLLPDIDIDIGRLAIDRLVVAPAVTGSRHIVRIAGNAHIAEGRAQVVANALTLVAPGLAGGDRLALKLDAVPERDRFDIDARLQAPVGGFVAGLAALKAPLVIAIDGAGTWKNWQGRALGRWGGQPLADLNITARDGSFGVRGLTRPGLYLQGPVERLTAPGLQVAIDTTLADRRADTRFQLRSDALAVAGQGLLDLGNSAFGNFRVDARLLTPGAIADNLNGRDVRASLLLDGKFATPVVDYDVQAAALGFGETVVQQVRAQGRARVDADRILIPIAARAARISGLNAAAGELLTNVVINGDLAISGDQILSDNLKMRSDRIDATAIVVADLGTGRYSGALKGRVNDYRVESVGILNVTTDAELVTAPGGGFGIQGRVAARTSQIFNEGARSFLGGNAVASARVALDPQGIIRFRDLRLNAPQFRVVSGSGQYDPAGGIVLNADAVSRQYGPLIARVTGTALQPVVLLRAPRPGVGVGLANLEARIRGTGTAYAVVASGGTDYGPFTADVLVRTGNALVLDINRVRFAGVNFAGRVQQTVAGPFAGRLSMAGSGINGAVVLASQQGVQRAQIAATATNAQIPGVAQIQIGRAIVNATIVNYADAPAIVGDVQMAAVRYNALVVRTARAKIDYRGGRGRAQLVADGSNTVPFRVAANASLSPNLYLVAAQGQANGIGFRTASPARITPAGSGYALSPTRIDFDRGTVRVAGRYGNGLTVQSRIDRLDLAVANAFLPGIGLGGTATGSVDFAQPTGASFPRADARITVSRFTRSSLAAVSDPVDIVFAGRLLPQGGDARAIVRRGGAVIGRMVATLQPLGGGGDWTERLLAAPLSGGIRYNGPAGVLFSLAGQADQQLSGAIGVAADFSGRVQQPRLNGVIRATSLVYENETYGTRLSNMRLQGRFTNDRLEITELRAVAGDGSVTAQGTIGLAADSGFPINIRARLDNARLARSDALGATATGDIAVTNDRNGGLITGTLRLPEARYQVIRQGAAEVAELEGIRRRSDAVRQVAQSGTAAVSTGLFRLDLRIVADNRLFVSGMGLESEWETDLRVTGTSANPRVTGTVEVVRGTYSFSGRRFDLTSGRITFEGGSLTNPQIAISATTSVEGVTAILNVAGSAQNPRVTFSSTPALPQDEVVSRILFGSSVTNLSAIQAIQLAAALNSLRGSGGGLNPLGTLRSASGIDRLRILGADQATGRGTALAAGQYISDDIYIEIITDARGFTATQLEVALSKVLSVLSQTSSFGGSSVNVRYSRDY